jgi:hypothetical protein
MHCSSLTDDFVCVRVRARVCLCVWLPPGAVQAVCTGEATAPVGAALGRTPPPPSPCVCNVFIMCASVYVQIDTDTKRLSTQVPKAIDRYRKKAIDTERYRKPKQIGEGKLGPQTSFRGTGDPSLPEPCFEAGHFQWMYGITSGCGALPVGERHSAVISTFVAKRCK